MTASARSNLMDKGAAAVATMIIAATTLAGCGGSSPYCDAITKDKSTLDTFGATKTTAGYTKYAAVASSLGKIAPTSVTKDWLAIAAAVNEVLTAQKKADLPLEDMDDVDKVATLDQEDLARVNDAFKKYNETSDEREAVVANIKTECDVTLKSA